jgi:hypothetical protein
MCASLALALPPPPPPCPYEQLVAPRLHLSAQHPPLRSPLPAVVILRLPRPRLRCRKRWPTPSAAQAVSASKSDSDCHAFIGEAGVVPFQELAVLQVAEGLRLVW